MINTYKIPLVFFLVGMLFTIVGALFKIMHWPNASTLLILGTTAEALSIVILIGLLLKKK